MYPRMAKPKIRAALRDTRVVTISGPRQSGKTTLARHFAKGGRKFLTLDDQSTLDAAKSDPVSFIRALDRAVIDEGQRAPDLLLVIKKASTQIAAQFAGQLTNFSGIGRSEPRMEPN
jgi:predicted AAA+ superfamily ATPase